MKSNPTPPSTSKRLVFWVLGAAVVVTALAVGLMSGSKPPPEVRVPQAASSAPALSTSARISALNDGLAWSELTAAQRAVLKPLERDWSQLDSTGKEKWVEIAARFPKLPASERERIEARMSEWARMTPKQRGEARLRFQQAKQATREERQKKWEAYQSLSGEEKQRLSKISAPAATDVKRRAADRRLRASQTDADGVQSKSNLVPNPAFSIAPRSVGPTIVQGGPGVSTHLLSKGTQAPAHQQPGMPKISATDEFVDAQTLLPKRGPQGAASLRTDRPVWVDPSLPAPLPTPSATVTAAPGSPPVNDALPTTSPAASPATATLTQVPAATPGPVMSNSERSDPVPENP